MNELVARIAAYVPDYLIALGRLLSGPKAFLAATKPDTEPGFRSGLQFLAVSVVLCVIALTPLSPEGSDFWKRLASVSVSELLAVGLGAGVIRWAWLLVGGNADTRSVVTLYCYAASVAVLCGAVTILISFGTAKEFNPGLYAALRGALRSGKPIPV